MLSMGTSGEALRVAERPSGEALLAGFSRWMLVLAGGCEVSGWRPSQRSPIATVPLISARPRPQTQTWLQTSVLAPAPGTLSSFSACLAFPLAVRLSPQAWVLKLLLLARLFSMLILFLLLFSFPLSLSHSLCLSAVLLSLHLSD